MAAVERFARDAPFLVRIERNPTNLGWRENFFRAISLCRGDLIALCDQDDVWRPEKVARCAGMFADHPGLSLVVHAGRVTTEDLRPTRRRWPPVYRNRTFEPDRVPMGFRHHGIGLVFPRWLIEEVDPVGRPLSLATCDDTFMNHDLWICLIAPTAGSVALLSDELVLYRRHASTASTIDLPLGGTSGWRGLFDAAAKEAEYRVIAGRRRETAAYLDVLGSRHKTLPSGIDGFRVDRQRGYHLRAADRLEHRAEVISAGRGRVQRLTQLGALVARGGYGRRGRGNLGPSRIPLDLALAILATTTRGRAARGR